MSGDRGPHLPRNSQTLMSIPNCCNMKEHETRGHGFRYIIYWFYMVFGCIWPFLFSILGSLNSCPANHTKFWQCIPTPIIKCVQIPQHLLDQSWSFWYSVHHFQIAIFLSHAVPWCPMVSPHSRLPGGSTTPSLPRRRLRGKCCVAGDPHPAGAASLKAELGYWLAV